MKVMNIVGFLILTLFSCSAFGNEWRGPSPCKKSETTASGSAIKSETFCSKELIFEDNFDSFDFENWQHENTLAGGGNWEFQWYTNNRSNSFVQDGKLYIQPTLTSDVYGEEFLTTGTINVNSGTPADQCTNPTAWGCERKGTPTHVLNPIRSARIRTYEAFNFKYGRIVIKAKMPSGDWLWPAIWLLPKRNVYGTWPVSGEIDIAETRGNKNFVKNGVNIGSEQILSTLHFAPHPALNAYKTAHFDRNSEPGQGYDQNFHIYEMEWTPLYIRFKVDNVEMGTIHANKGFWHRGNFPSGLDNPWKNGDKMAPFDQEFYIVLNVAVGGVNFFPDDAENPTPKPWKNNSTQAATDFWNDRSSWLSSWNLNDKENYPSALIVDYVRVYAL